MQKFTILGCMFFSACVQAGSLSLDEKNIKSQRFQNQYGTSYYAAPYYGAPLTEQQRKVLARQQYAFRIHEQKYQAALSKRNVVLEKRDKDSEQFLSQGKINQRYVALSELSAARHKALLQKVEQHRLTIEGRIKARRVSLYPGEVNSGK